MKSIEYYLNYMYIFDVVKTIVNKMYMLELMYIV